MARAKALPSADFLREVLIYDPTTGVLTRRVGSQGTQVGAVAGSPDLRGYIRLSINCTLFLAHRVIWKMVTGIDPPEQVDHIDGNKSNNAWSNLRCASQSENCMNRSLSTRNANGIKGLSWHTEERKWRVNLMAKGRRYERHFACFGRAILDIKNMRQNLHGEFARGL
jgi:hypothetical protein